jgi:hypothetical protein
MMRVRFSVRSIFLSEADSTKIQYRAMSALPDAGAGSSTTELSATNAYKNVVATIGKI